MTPTPTTTATRPTEIEEPVVTDTPIPATDTPEPVQEDPDTPVPGQPEESAGLPDDGGLPPDGVASQLSFALPTLYCSVISPGQKLEFAELQVLEELFICIGNSDPNNGVLFTVFDPDGVVIAQAEQMTDGAGRAEFVWLPSVGLEPGQYQISVQQRGEPDSFLLVNLVPAAYPKMRVQNAQVELGSRLLVEMAGIRKEQPLFLYRNDPACGSSIGCYSYFAQLEPPDPGRNGQTVYSILTSDDDVEGEYLLTFGSSFLLPSNVAQQGFVLGDVPQTAEVVKPPVLIPIEIAPTPGLVIVMPTPIAKPNDRIVDIVLTPPVLKLNGQVVLPIVVPIEIDASELIKPELVIPLIPIVIPTAEK